MDHHQYCNTQTEPLLEFPSSTFGDYFSPILALILFELDHLLSRKCNLGSFSTAAID